MLRERVALITGAGSGIGRATALLFSKDEAKIVVADIDVRYGEETAEVIRGMGGEAINVCADVSNGRDVRNMMQAVVDKYHRLDILVNNAGNAGRGKSLEKTSEEDWDRALRSNLTSVFLCSKHAVPVMTRANRGSVINIASNLAFVGMPNYSAYCASKGGVVSLTKALAVELAPLGIRVNCICPGPIETPRSMEGKTPEEIGFIRQRQRKTILTGPMGRPIGIPEDIANAALYLASDESSFVTGSAFLVDGGTTCYHPRTLL